MSAEAGVDEPLRVALEPPPAEERRAQRSGDCGDSHSPPLFAASRLCRRSESPQSSGPSSLCSDFAPSALSLFPSLSVAVLSFR